MTALSVNLNKIALLRNSRGESQPGVVDAARVCIEAGCQGLTLHPRPDLRHARPQDVAELAQIARLANRSVANALELNIEGNPFAPANAQGYPGFVDLVERARPAQCTLVPDSDAQLTSDHGFDLARDAERLRPLIARLKGSAARVSLFVDAGAPDIERAADLGADRIEIYTGPYAKAHARGDAAAALECCARTARAAQASGLGVNAGHDLDQHNLDAFLRAVPGVLEVSIGHALIADALYAGLAATVRAYLRVIAQAAQ